MKDLHFVLLGLLRWEELVQSTGVQRPGAQRHGLGLLSRADFSIGAAPLLVSCLGSLDS